MFNFNFGIKDFYRVRYPKTVVTCVLLENDVYIQLDEKGYIYFRNQPGQRPETRGKHFRRNKDGSYSNLPA